MTIDQIIQKFNHSRGADIIINDIDEDEPCAICGTSTYRAFRTDQGERFALCTTHTTQAHNAILNAAKRGASADAKSLSQIVSQAPLDPDTAHLAQPDAPAPGDEFDLEEIAREVISVTQSHYSRIGMRLYFGGTPPSKENPFEASPLLEEIRLLVRVANGRISRKDADELLVGEVAETIQDMAELLCAPAMFTAYQIPYLFWRTAIGRAMATCRGWLSGDWLTLSQAARMLYGKADRATLMRVNRLVEASTLTAHLDPHEPNPRRAQRVSRTDVLALKRKK